MQCLNLQNFALHKGSGGAGAPSERVESLLALGAIRKFGVGSFVVSLTRTRLRRLPRPPTLARLLSLAAALFDAAKRVI